VTGANEFAMPVLDQRSAIARWHAAQRAESTYVGWARTESVKKKNTAAGWNLKALC
jgi:hypothetical protein